MNTQLDPNEDDAGALWAEIHRLRDRVAGPPGFSSWQEAATAERVRRVKAERELAAYRSTPADGGGHGVTPLTAAARDVLAERQRQVSVEGWTPRHDDDHEEGELSLAAAGYAWAASDQIQCVVKEFDGPESSMDDPVLPQDKAWPHGWQFKPCPPRRALIKAAALILAEIERLDRRYGTPASTGGEGRG